MSCQRRNPLNLFEEETTYNIAYVDHNVDRDKIKFYKGPFEHEYKEKIYNRKPARPLYLNTYMPWHKEIQFDALWTPKPITQTSPYEKFNPDLKIVDEDKESAIKTRPRVYMLPQVSMDDISDRELRKFIIDNMYTSDWKKISSEVPLKCTKRDISDTTLEDPIVKKLSLLMDLVNHYPLKDPCNWKEKCEEWEANYPEHVVDQTEGFWEDFKHKYQPVPGVDPYKGFVSVEDKKEIRELIERDELSQRYDKFVPGYTGYIPQFASGPLKKKDIYKNPYNKILKKEGCS